MGKSSEIRRRRRINWPDELQGYLFIFFSIALARHERTEYQVEISNEFDLLQNSEEYSQILCYLDAYMENLDVFIE